uniref:Uncharacterized protein n=1 Tax=Tanacetum cinerariifolium TaxID=118510 RepID=A0A6L2LAR3_TANCI|nr:hypothetical protein [Tanacetum cinerariifolium]
MYLHCYTTTIPTAAPFLNHSYTATTEPKHRRNPQNHAHQTRCSSFEPSVASPSPPQSRRKTLMLLKNYKYLCVES